MKIPIEKLDSSLELLQSAVDQVLAFWQQGNVAGSSCQIAAASLNASDLELVECFQGVLGLLLRRQLTEYRAIQFFSLVKKSLASASPGLSHGNVFALLVDCIWLLDLNLQPSSTTSAAVPYKLLTSLCRALIDENLVAVELFKGKMDPEFLETLALIPSASAWNKKTIKLNTTLLYRQQKFNLLREEPEGYAKLIAEINRRSRFEATPARVQATMDVINSLIGFFDLDPNRVLDIVLDVFADQVSRCSEFFVQLISISPWIRQPPGLVHNPIASLLGHKFAFHAKVSADFGASWSLFLAVAILIKRGLIALADIFPHLSPDDSELQKEYDDHVAACQNAVNAVGNSSMLAPSSLTTEPDGSPSKSIEAVASSASSPEKPIKLPTSGAPGKQNQKFSLTEALFAVGDVKNGVVMLSRFPKMCAVRQTISAHLTRCVHYILEPLYKALRPKCGIPRKTADASDVDPFSPCRNFGSFARHYTEWSYGIEQCESWDTLLSVLVPFLEFLGPMISTDISLLTKVIRLAKHHMSIAPVAERKIWLEVISAYVLPALSLSGPNMGLISELWEVLKPLPYQTRYTLYGAWKTSVYDNNSELFFTKAETVSQTKKILRRISKENVKQFGRHLSKVSHSNPAICFMTLMDQIQVYENLIGPIVDCFRYMTDLEFDVLCYILLESFANPKKERLKTDGTNISIWLSGLASFAGNLFKRHPNVEITSLLHYIFYQGKDGNVLDLVILKELVSKMSGVEQFVEGISEQQLEASSGGDLLRAESLTVVAGQQVKNVKKSSLRLAKSLLDSNLVIQLAILIGKQRSACVFHTEIDHLKLLSSLYDQVQETLSQYIDFLESNIDRNVYAELCPGLRELCLSFGIDPEVAWFIVRPKISYLMKKLEAETSAAMDTSSSEQIWHATLQPIVHDVIGIFPDEKVWTALSPEFYTTFWHLTLFDIQVPEARYKAEIARQKALAAFVESVPDSLQVVRDEAQVTKRKKDKDRAGWLVDKLEKEMEAQCRHVEKTGARLVKEKDWWFSGRNNRFDLINSVLQYCIRPRCFFSANDALFCAKFIERMHTLGTYNFSSLSLLDRIFSDVNCTIFMCTQNEASNYGRFLKEILELVHRWHSDPAVYHRECVQRESGEFLPGFKKRWQTPSNTAVDQTLTAEQILDYESFRTIVIKWHLRLHKEYMKMRNSIIILDRLAEIFPIIKHLGAAFEKKIQAIIKEETRHDMKILLIRYDAALQKHKPKWTAQEAFHATPIVSSSEGAPMEVKEVAPVVSNVEPNAERLPEQAVPPSDNAMEVEEPVISRSSSIEELRTEEVKPLQPQEATAEETKADKSTEEETDLARTLREKLLEAVSAKKLKDEQSSPVSQSVSTAPAPARQPEPPKQADLPPSRTLRAEAESFRPSSNQSSSYRRLSDFPESARTMERERRNGDRDQDQDRRRSRERSTMADRDAGRSSRERPPLDRGGDRWSRESSSNSRDFFYRETATGRYPPDSRSHDNERPSDYAFSVSPLKRDSYRSKDYGESTSKRRDDPPRARDSFDDGSKRRKVDPQPIEARDRDARRHYPENKDSIDYDYDGKPADLPSNGRSSTRRNINIPPSLSANLASNNRGADVNTRRTGRRD